MMRRPVWALATAALLALAGPFPALAQEAEESPVETRLQIPQVDVGAHPEVRMTVTAPRQLGGVDLTPEAFTLLEDGSPRAVEARRLPSDDLEVVLALDTSGSMGVEPMEAVKAAALEFVAQMPPGVHIAVLEFATEAALLSPFTRDREDTRATISQLASGGRTALFDAVHESVAAFDWSRPARRVIVLICDGEENNSGTNLPETLDVLAEHDVDLHVIELVTQFSDADVLRQLAAEGGGDVVSIDDPAALQDVYAEIASNLVNQYELTFQSEAHGRTRIDVAVDHDGVSATSARHVTFPPPPATEPEEEPQVAPAVPAVREGEVVRPGLLANTWTLYVGAAVFYVALALGILILLAPRRRRATLQGAQRRPRHAMATVSGIAERATVLADRALERSGRRGRLDKSLERAGINLRASEWVVLVGCGVVVAASVGWLLGGLFVAIPLAAVVVAVSPLVISHLADRRQAAFADQLSDTLQLLAGSLRAGYGIMQAVDVVAKEADSPTSEEFQRLLVETRLGRDVHESLRGIAERMNSDDFEWIVQAIDIHREVGGDLAEVLDTVGDTIRERGQLRRQVKSLSAEGRLSALVLMLLPFVMVAILWVLNRDYLLELTQDRLGHLMLAMGAALLGAGGLWLRRIIRLEY